MQNSLLPPPPVATHLTSTIRSTMESMTFPSGITRINRRKQQHCNFSPSRTTSQHNHPTHHTMQPICFSTQANHTHTPTTPSTQPLHPKPPYHTTIQTKQLLSPPSKATIPYNHTNKPAPLTAPILYTQLPPLFYLTFPCIHKYIIVFIAELSRMNTVIRKNPW
jgi:hypothetical protein